MYLANYAPQELAGFNPIKRLKKDLKKIKKVVKKVAKPVAHIAAAYVTGGASLSLSAQMMAKKKAKKAQAKQTAALQREQASLQRQIGPSIAPASSMTAVRSLAPSYDAVASSQFMPTVPTGYQTEATGLEPGFFAPGGPGDPGVSPAKLPAWAIPAGVGAAGLLVLLSRRKGR